MNKFAQLAYLTLFAGALVYSALLFNEDTSVYDDSFEHITGTEHIGVYKWDSEGSSFHSCDGKAIYSVNFESLTGFEDHPEAWDPFGPWAITRYLKVRGSAFGTPEHVGMLREDDFDAEITIYETLENSEHNIFDCMEVADRWTETITIDPSMTPLHYLPIKPDWPEIEND